MRARSCSRPVIRWSGCSGRSATSATCCASSRRAPARSIEQAMRIERRRAVAADRQFLEDVHVAALGPVALVGYGWPAITLREQFRAEIDLSSCYVIGVDGARAGYLSIEDRGGYWYIDAIAIAPKYQRKGVGTRVLR